VHIGEEAVDELISISGGDLRKSITLLQSMACAGLPISKGDVRETSGYVPEDQIQQLMKTAQSGDLKKLVSAVKLFNRQGFRYSGKKWQFHWASIELSSFQCLSNDQPIGRCHFGRWTSPAASKGEDIHQNGCTVLVRDESLRKRN
jgi:DNA polymerase III delta prime subunit